jgi:molybdopterin/thiamine biosynthesis adenylyltransferase
MRITNISVSSVSEDPFDRQRRIEWWDQDRIGAAKVLVAGAGATGNETLKNLALLGFRNVLICDFDTIETSNLSRTVLFGREDIGRLKAEVAAERFRGLALASDVKVGVFTGDIVWELGLGTIADFDIVMSCLDNVEARKFLGSACRRLGVSFVDSGISGLAGHVSVYPPGGGACYSCNLSQSQEEAAKKRYSCDFVRRRAMIEHRVPTVQVAASIVSGVQCQEAIKSLMGIGRESAFRFAFDGRQLVGECYELLENELCSGYQYHTDVRFVDTEFSHQIKLRDLLELSSDFVGANPKLDLTFDREVVLGFVCQYCGRPHTVFKPLHVLFDDDLTCGSEVCADGIKKDGPKFDAGLVRCAVFDTSFEGGLELTLSDIGVPDRHIVLVRGDVDSVYFRLSPALVNGC